MKPIIVAPIVALALAGAGTGAYFLGTSEGGEEEAVVGQPTLTPEPSGTATPTPTPNGETGVQRLRWGNVTIDSPDRESGISVVRLVEPLVGSDDMPAWKQTIVITRSGGDWLSRIDIDAETGEVIIDMAEEEDRAALEAVVKTIRVEPFQTDVAGWPYNGSPPKDRVTWGKMTFPQPDPLSGMIVELGSGDSPEGSSTFITINNGQSQRMYDADTGDEILPVHPTDGPTDLVQEEDRAAFDVFGAAIQMTVE